MSTESATCLVFALVVAIILGASLLATSEEDH